MKLTPRLFCAGAILATLRVAHAVYAADDREFRGHTPRVTAPRSDELMRGDGLEWILSLQAWRDFHSLPPRRAARPPKCTLPQAEAQQDRQDTAAAIRKIAEQEEKALLESRQRRAAVLDAAHRHFNNFDKILAWPPQSFWDKIGGTAIKSVGRAGPKMTTEEAAVLDTLKSSRVDLRFDAALFPTILGDLIAASSVYFVIDAGAWRDLESAEISLQASGVTVHDALQLIMLQASAEGEVVWEITGNIVRFIKKADQKRTMTLRIHPAADFAWMTDFIPPQITQVSAGSSENGMIEEFLQLVRGSVAAGTWDDAGGTITAQGKNLVVYNTAGAQNEVAQFLDDLRAFSGLVRARRPTHTCYDPPGGGP